MTTEDKKKEKKNFGIDPASPEGILSQMRQFSGLSKEDERMKRLDRVAKVNAFGDLMKHLGAFAGGGYAPTQKRTENPGVLSALQKIDRIREQQHVRPERFGDRLNDWLKNAYRSGLPDKSAKPAPSGFTAGSAPQQDKEADGLADETRVQPQIGAISRFYPDGMVELEPEVITGIREIDGGSGSDYDKMVAIVRFLKDRGAGKDEVRNIIKTFQD